MKSAVFEHLAIIGAVKMRKNAIHRYTGEGKAQKNAIDCTGKWSAFMQKRMCDG
jgi:hypothetical protein